MTFQFPVILNCSVRVLSELHVLHAGDVLNDIPLTHVPVDIPDVKIKVQPFLSVAPLVAQLALIVKLVPAVLAVVWRLCSILYATSQEKFIPFTAPVQETSQIVITALFADDNRKNPNVAAGVLSTAPLLPTGVV